MSADPAVADAAQQARVALALLDRLGMPKELAATRRLLARADELGEQVRQGRMRASQAQGEFLRALITGNEPLDPDRLQAVLTSTVPWVGARADQGELAPAVALVAEASRGCRAHAAQAAAAESPRLYQRLQHEAAGCVEVAISVPKPPKKLWALGDRASHEAMMEGYEAAWAKLARAQERFGLIHQLAAVLRSMGALGAAALLPDGAPAWGYVYRQWPKALEGEAELRTITPTLRLRWAAEHGWEPGLWLASDLVRPEPEHARRGLVGFLVPSPLRSAPERLGVG